MDIKSQLIDILQKENHTFQQLCEYVSLTEEELTLSLSNKTLELRTLELISKALCVPLYSFFSENKKINHSEKPYYINRLLTKNDIEKNDTVLNEEIELLQKVIILKQEQLKRLLTD